MTFRLKPPSCVLITLGPVIVGRPLPQDTATVPLPETFNNVRMLKDQTKCDSSLRAQTHELLTINKLPIARSMYKVVQR